MNIEMTPKLFTCLKQGLRPGQLKKDISSGILVGIIALPLAIAFAIASGSTPEKGILTAIIAGFIISFFGGSRVQIGGPTGAFIVIILSIQSQYGYEGLLISTLMAGVILILMGVLRLGSLLKYIPQTLITGFTTAIAIIIFTTQVKDFLGLQAAVPDAFLNKWIFYIRHINQSSFYSVLIGLVTIAIILLLPRLTRKVPAAFAAIVITTVISAAANLPVETIYTRFGTMEFSGFIPAIPQFSLNTLSSYIAPAFTIAILGALESLLSAVVADGMIGGKHRSNIELIAQGLANVITPLFGGLPATGAIARTAANINNGGRTPIAGIVHALTLLLIYLIAMPVVKYIPMSTLAGILFMVAWNMAELREFFNILRVNIYEAMVLLATFFLTLFMDLTIAIPVGFMLSVILFMKRMSDSVELNPLMSTKTVEGKIFSHEIGEYSEGIVIYELNGPMFFGSVHHLLNISRTLKSHQSTLILRFRYVPIVDSSGLVKLKMIIRELEKKDIQLIFSGVNPAVKKKFLNQNMIEEKRIFDDIESAVVYAESINRGMPSPDLK
ncbi:MULTISPECIES: SulP family inorganic anion transporter [unclassified Oceanispirochaeta]|uniref:SulP family inorganic anion transporter n=1 Tax=unclassified Oceanispirochaeta TaxID=2635722 RepID=UPI000E08F1E1|nr:MULTISPECIES: SulP family inorganic anion transporter [unclassified Oceanispirochaeta]MBF9017557.1 STAS domain-containing protein [Oceanispirochaeta sp. M2]NPD74129.1 STAS domain-containing protein [Oceanispirochaeta sp. M1]RDG30050.1 STAS domain-containing protein [Oceanispirochaeta sp. M1]